MHISKKPFPINSGKVFPLFFLYRDSQQYYRNRKIKSVKRIGNSIAPRKTRFGMKKRISDKRCGKKQHKNSDCPYIFFIKNIFESYCLS